VPEHGDERNYGMSRHVGPDVELTDGQRTATAPMSGCVASTCEKFCAHCRLWIHVRGVTGALAFMAKHDSADCTNQPPGEEPTFKETT